MLKYITDVRGKTRLADIAADGTATEITDSDGLARTINAKIADLATPTEPEPEPDPVPDDD